MTVPAITKLEVDYVNVTYAVQKSDLKKAATALGDEYMPATKVGLKTFERFLESLSRR